MNTLRLLLQILLPVVLFGGGAGLVLLLPLLVVLRRRRKRDPIAEKASLLREATLVTLLSSAAFAVVGAAVALAFGFGALESTLVGAAMMFSSTSRAKQAARAKEAAAMGLVPLDPLEQHELQKKLDASSKVKGGVKTTERAVNVPRVGRGAAR